MPKLTVVIPKSQEGDLTYEWAKRELAEIDHEIIMPLRWSAGLGRAKGEYICFLEKDCVLAPRYFASLMDQFVDKPSFRKLAMVSPALGINSYNRLLYGYRVRGRDVYPSLVPSSTSPYQIQIGYVPGSIIRRSAIGALSPRAQDAVTDSVNMSLYLWSNGQRVIIVPTTLYISTDVNLDSPYWFRRSHNIHDMAKVIQQFKREEIG